MKDGNIKIGIEAVECMLQWAGIDIELALAESDYYTLKEIVGEQVEREKLVALVKRIHPKINEEFTTEQLVNHLNAIRQRRPVSTYKLSKVMNQMESQTERLEKVVKYVGRDGSRITSMTSVWSINGFSREAFPQFRPKEVAGEQATEATT